MPSNIGLKVDDELRIVDVISGSAAGNAGLTAGEKVVSINGHRLHTVADIQFALHQVSDPGKVNLETTTDRKTLTLTQGWRASDISWRASMYGMPPRPGLWVQAISASEKQAAGIAEGALGLKVRGVFGADVRKHGLKKGDIIVQFGDETTHFSEGEFHAHLRLNYYQPNSKLKLRLLREGKRKQLTVTFANR